MARATSRATSDWMARTSLPVRSYTSPQACAPFEARTRPTRNRSRWPACWRLPVTSQAARRIRPRVRGSSADRPRTRCDSKRDLTSSRRTWLSRMISSSVRPSASQTLAVSWERLSRYSTATLLGTGRSARASRHGGGEPSGHWARRTVGQRDRGTEKARTRSSPVPPSSRPAVPRFIVLPQARATRPACARSADRPAGCRRARPAC